MRPFASAVCDVILELPYSTSTVSYARLWQKHAYFIFFPNDTDTTPDKSESTYHTPGNKNTTARYARYYRGLFTGRVKVGSGQGDPTRWLR